MADSIPKYKLKAGRKAVAQLMRAVASADLARTGTLPPVQRAEAARALADLHELEESNQVSVVEFYDTAQGLREAAATFVEVYSVSLRELVALASAHGQGQREQDDSSCGTGLPDANGVRGGGRASSSSCSDSRGAAAAVSSSEGHGALPSSEDWVPLLADSSAVVANSLWAVVSTNTAGSDMRHFYAGSSSATRTRAATSGDTRKGHFRSCAVSLASALLHSDALPALSRLLSAEAQRGPARALLTPRQLTTCLKPLSALLMAAHTSPDVLLPADPPSLRERCPPAPSSQTATTSTTPAPSCVLPTPDRTPGTAASPAACPTATTQPPTPQTLGPAMLCALVESGVVEAACRAAVGLAEQGGGERQQQQQRARSPGDDHSALLRELLLVLFQVHDTRKCSSADRDKQVQGGPLRTILTGPCAQVCHGRNAGRLTATSRLIIG